MIPTTMHLLKSQKADVWSIIEESGVEGVFRIDESQDEPIVRLGTAYFHIRGGSSAHQLHLSPGEKALTESHDVGSWRDVMVVLSRWLTWITRERRAAETGSGVAGPPPDWAISELPSRYAEMVSEIATLTEQERRWRRMAGLLWETGIPLNKIVRDAFRASGLGAELTTPGATYDVTVSAGAHRLLVEVTGIEGQVTKGKKITQVLDTIQSHANDGDRVVLAANAYRDKPLADRAKLEPISPEALNLLVRLGAVVVTTADLFAVWKLSLDDKEQARARLEALLTAPAGIARLG